MESKGDRRVTLSSMDRDYDVFPDDDNGDVLWSMQEQGDNLSKQREIDFCAIFPTEVSALQFAALLLKTGQKVSFSAYEGSTEMPWQVLVHPIMLPTYDNITRFEMMFGEDASQFGGRNDGWGSIEQG